MPIVAAPGKKYWMDFGRSENVVSRSGWLNDISPIGSMSYPIKCGSCLRMIITPIAASSPLITLVGKNEEINPALRKPKAN